MQRFGPAASHTAYRENNPPRYLHEPLDRPVSAQAHYGRQYAYVPQYAPVTRPVIEQKVYNERITPQAPPPPPTTQQQHHHSVYPSSSPIKQENHDLRVKVADLQMRIDRLLKGRDDIEAEGSATITMWDELLTQICDLYAITVNKVR